MELIRISCTKQCLRFSIIEEVVKTMQEHADKLCVFCKRAWRYSKRNDFGIVSAAWAGIAAMVSHHLSFKNYPTPEGQSVSVLTITARRLHYIDNGMNVQRPDLMSNYIPFCGKVMILGEYFRQVVLMVPRPVNIAQMFIFYAMFQVIQS
ncbi:hypothetical protein J6590_016564 [Homalodisca vitripennis]|nr:hypothetical protein J6590_016564 [Homalodisca vitripennis]